MNDFINAHSTKTLNNFAIPSICTSCKHFVKITGIGKNALHQTSMTGRGHIITC